MALYCPRGHQAIDPQNAGPHRVRCGCGALVRTDEASQDAYREGATLAAPVDVAETAPADSGHPSDVDTPAAVDLRGVDVGGQGAGWTDDEAGAPAQLPTDDEDPTDDQDDDQAPDVEPPRAGRPRDFLDAIAQGSRHD